MDDDNPERRPNSKARLNSSFTFLSLLNSAIAPVMVGLAFGIAFILTMIFVMEDRTVSGKAFYGSSGKDIAVGISEPDEDAGHDDVPSQTFGYELKLKQNENER